MSFGYLIHVSCYSVKVPLGFTANIIKEKKYTECSCERERMTTTRHNVLRKAE